MMAIDRVETELVAISQQLRSITVEIANHRSGGSGVIWSADGLVITNSHVVEESTTKIKLNNGRVIKGSVIARDIRQDLAAIEINFDENERLFIPSIGNIQLLRPGEIVLAMGSPWGFSGALTAGVIHCTQWQKAKKTELDWTEKIYLKQSLPASYIVADIRLAPGNSGGVLANVRGEVIGVNAAIYNGLALAIPSQQVEEFIKTIVR